MYGLAGRISTVSVVGKVRARTVDGTLVGNSEGEVSIIYDDRSPDSVTSRVDKINQSISIYIDHTDTIDSTLGCARTHSEEFEDHRSSIIWILVSTFSPEEIIIEKVIRRGRCHFWWLYSLYRCGEFIECSGRPWYQSLVADSYTVVIFGSK